MTAQAQRQVLVESMVSSVARGLNPRTLGRSLTEGDGSPLGLGVVALKAEIQAGKIEGTRAACETWLREWMPWVDAQFREMIISDLVTKNIVSETGGDATVVEYKEQFKLRVGTRLYENVFNTREQAAAFAQRAGLKLTEAAIKLTHEDVTLGKLYSEYASPSITHDGSTIYKARSSTPLSYPRFVRLTKDGSWTGHDSKLNAAPVVASGKLNEASELKPGQKYRITDVNTRSGGYPYGIFRDKPGTTFIVKGPAGSSRMSLKWQDGTPIDFDRGHLEDALKAGVIELAEARTNETTESAERRTSKTMRATLMTESGATKLVLVPKGTRGLIESKLPRGKVSFVIAEAAMQAFTLDGDLTGNRRPDRLLAAINNELNGIEAHKGLDPSIVKIISTDEDPDTFVLKVAPNVASRVTALLKTKGIKTAPAPNLNEEDDPDPSLAGKTVVVSEDDLEDTADDDAEDTVNEAMEFSLKSLNGAQQLIMRDGKAVGMVLKSGGTRGENGEPATVRWGAFFGKDASLLRGKETAWDSSPDAALKALVARGNLPESRQPAKYTFCDSTGKPLGAYQGLTEQAALRVALAEGVSLQNVDLSRTLCEAIGPEEKARMAKLVTVRVTGRNPGEREGYGAFDPWQNQVDWDEDGAALDKRLKANGYTLARWR